jgi:biotin synthase
MGMMIEWSPHRIIMPETQVRLSAGRMNMSREGQACAFAGANSIFAGDKLLTTPDVNEDMKMFEMLGLNPKTIY